LFFDGFMRIKKLEDVRTRKSLVKSFSTHYIDKIEGWHNIQNSGLVRRPKKGRRLAGTSSWSLSYSRPRNMQRGGCNWVRRDQKMGSEEWCPNPAQIRWLPYAPPQNYIRNAIGVKKSFTHWYEVPWGLVPWRY
jgi:hypothetical protein